MKLKVKTIKLEAARPIALINQNFAQRFSIHEGDRIEILYDGKRLVLIVDLISTILKENEIALSDEALSFLDITGKNPSVEVNQALEPRSTRFIFKKLEGKQLSKEEIFSIIHDVVNNALTEAEIAYFVSGVFEHGMSTNETIWLTDAIARTGKILKWKTKNVADKHSIGGIPGNRTTPIVVSICAAAGIIMPKTSSKVITTAAATADVLEVITNVNLSIEELKKVVEKTGACLAWGGSLGFAPADYKLIRVERLLNIDPESQLIASILAKKISVGSHYVLIDIPYGEGAKVNLKQAKHLKERFIKIGKAFGLKIKVVLTHGDQPIGNGIGPVLEIKDILRIFQRDNPPKDLEDKSIFLAAQILEMMHEAKPGKGESLAREILDSGKAYKKFQEIVEAQGKKNPELKEAKFKRQIISQISGKMISIDNKKINLLGRVLGCPTDISAGMYLHKHKHDNVSKGEKILTLYSESQKKLQEAVSLYKSVKPIIIS